MQFCSVCIILLVFSFRLGAQQPSHILIGMEELSGIDVYSIVRGKNSVIWLGTSEGLMSYDGYDFRNHEGKDLESRSLFGLVFDANGLLYCHSINGRIYRVVDDKLELYYSLPSEIVMGYMFMCFDDRNELIISSKDYYRLNHSRELVKLQSSSVNEIHMLGKRANGEILIVDSDRKLLKGYKNGELSILGTLPSEVEANYFHPIQAGDKIIGTSGNGHDIFLFDEKKFERIVFSESSFNGKSVNVFCKGSSDIWVASSTNGAYCFDIDGESVFGSQLLFSEYRVSDVFKDKEGSYWLGTLGKGIIFIPNGEVIDIGANQSFQQLNLLSICADKKNNVYIGSQEGEVYKLSAEAIDCSVRQVGSLSDDVARLTYLSGTNELYAGVAYYNLKTKSFVSSAIRSRGRPKSFFKKGWLIPDRQGIRFDQRDKEAKIPTDIFEFSFIGDSISKTANLNIGRTYALDFDVRSKTIWAGTSLGLFQITKNEKTKIRLNGRAIIASEIVHANNETWVATRNLGLLRYRNNTLIKHYTSYNGLRSNRILDIKVVNEYIYILYSSGIQRLKATTDEFRSVGKSKGLNSNRIIAFELTKNHLWVISPKGLQRFKMTVFDEKTPIPSPYLTEILVNNKKSDQSMNTFNYQENRLQFRFAVKGFKNRNDLKYRYQLKGISDEWNQLDFDENKIEFPSLPSGAYTFTLVSINVDGEESAPVVYTFQINPPFWREWWFYLLCFVGFFGGLVFLFQIRMKIIKRRLVLEKQLRVSEIKAIKSQMNPHFVFNALNSVQDLMMMDDARSSNLYLSHFASLMRKTLEFSSEQFISLEDEIEMLELYLQLEKLRFGDDFHYEVITDLNQHDPEYLIPTMLIQPYVENAIKHGLLHKKGNKQLTISFRKLDNRLCCEIRDNGVGRSKSEEINRRQPFRHHSFSTKANESRIDLINQTLSQKIDFKIIDLKENGVGVGTVVIFFFMSIE